MGSNNSTSLDKNGFQSNTNSKFGSKLKHDNRIRCDERVNKCMVLKSLKGLSMVHNYIWQIDFRDDVHIVNDLIRIYAESE